MSQTLSNNNQPQQVAQAIIDLLAHAVKTDYIGEPISQLEHALQAAHFATAEGMDDEGVLGALLHDIGHLIEPEAQDQMGNYGVMEHEALGANYLLERGFSKKIATLVTGHVAAKRYLVSTSDNYYERLSPASRKTLEYQGGKMTSSEIANFKAQPYFREILQVRLCDEKAKQVDFKCAALDTYLPMITKHLAAQQSKHSSKAL